MDDTDRLACQGIPMVIFQGRYPTTSDVILRELKADFSLNGWRMRTRAVLLKGYDPVYNKEIFLPGTGLNTFYK
jgi:hypothetical protein